MRAVRVLAASALAASIAAVGLTACGGSESSTTTVTTTTTTTTTTGPQEVATTNPPWYPSLQAFEHYNSGRSHVFSQAKFGGSLRGKNQVSLLKSSDGAYPSGYNMSYLDENAAFIQGGSYGDVENSIGPFVAKVDPKTLKPVWYTQLVNTVETYLDEDGSVTPTAERLFTHRHTVRYRLERVKEVTGLDLTSTEGREKVGLGLKAMRVLGIAPPRGPANEPGTEAGKVGRTKAS